MYKEFETNVSPAGEAKINSRIVCVYRSIDDKEIYHGAPNADFRDIITSACFLLLDFYVKFI